MSERIDPHLLELINGLADGQLDATEQAELRRRMEQDPSLAKVYRQVQVIRSLVCGLDRQQAPTDLWERVRDRVERDTLLAAMPSLGGGKSVRHRLGRYLAVAAAVAVVGILGLTVYSVLSPGRSDRGFGILVVDQTYTIPQGGPVGPVGRLELQVRNLEEMVMYMDRTLQCLALDVQAEQYATRRVYRVVFGREQVKGLVDGLGDVWHRFESASLYIETGAPGQPIRVSAVRPGQLGQILDQSDKARRIEIARQVAVANTIDQDLPGQRLLATAVGVHHDELPAVPRPVLTSGQVGQVNRDRPVSVGDGMQLTIVLCRGD